MFSESGVTSELKRDQRLVGRSPESGMSAPEIAPDAGQLLRALEAVDLKNWPCAGRSGSRDLDDLRLTASMGTSGGPCGAG